MARARRIIEGGPDAREQEEIEHELYGPNAQFRAACERTIAEEGSCDCCCCTGRCAPLADALRLSRSVAELERVTGYQFDLDDEEAF